jgi:NAD(P)-dependent dehydrogenase (short-subunit alcohol dehydrogenase family)
MAEEVAAMVEAFAAAGASVIVASNEEAACFELESALKRTGCEALAVPCDVSKKSELEALVAASLNGFGRIDVLVCNAGIQGHFGPMHTASDAEIDSLFSVNLQHPLRLTSMVAPLMANRGSGSIIVTASIAGLRGNKNVGMYGIAKAAVVQLTRNLAVEWGPRNVRANAIAPGLIATEWASAIVSNDEATTRRLGMTPLRRIGKPSEIAATALFLASSGAAFITGQTIVVDGGTLISDGN